MGCIDEPVEGGPKADADRSNERTPNESASLSMGDMGDMGGMGGMGGLRDMGDLENMGLVRLDVRGWHTLWWYMQTGQRRTWVTKQREGGCWGAWMWRFQMMK